jgi:predicted dehydrogenase
MAVQRVGIILSGVTGRMGANQHLARSIVAIMKQGGVRVSDDLAIMPDPILVGRSENKLRALAEHHGGLKFTTDLDAALGDASYPVFFDASATQLRKPFVERAVAAGKSIYCEKPTADHLADALSLAATCEKAGVKNGVVQDKLWLPGIRKLRQLIDSGFFGRILSVRGEFGYWVFTGHVHDQPAQRPSWNYRAADGGGIVIDMFCHWQYVLENLFGGVKSLVAWANTDVSERIDERGHEYAATADDSAYAMFLLEGRGGGTVMAQFNSSWCTRVRRDDLLTIQVDGTKGSAVAGLRECWIQPESATPRPVWNPDVPQPIDFRAGWTQMPSATTYDNAFKAQWELFLRHVVLDEPFRWTLREGAKGVQLAELGLKSWKQRQWVEVGEL